jgi:hypothetical protein
MSAMQQSPILQTTETGSQFLQDGRQWVWNSSTLSPAKTCSRKYYYQVILGWIPRGENVHLLFGSIYASSLELYHRLRANGADHNSATRDVVLEALTKSWGKLDAATLRDLPGSPGIRPANTSSAQSYGISMNTKTIRVKQSFSLTEVLRLNLLLNSSSPMKSGSVDILIDSSDTLETIMSKIKKQLDHPWAHGILKDIIQITK